MKPIIYLISFLFFFSLSNAQNIDSLAQIINRSVNDSIKVKALAEMSEVCELKEIPLVVRDILKISSAKLRDFPLPDSTKYFYLKNTALALNNLGYYYENLGENKKSQKYFLQALSLYKLINDLKGIGTAYSNLGSVYDNNGDIRAAIDYYFKSLKLREILNDEIGRGNNLHNIASLYHRQGENENAYKYAEKSLNVRSKIKDKDGMAFSYNLLAQLCFEKGDTACSINYFLKCTNLYTSLNKPTYLARSSTNLAKIYKLRQQYGIARSYFSQALDIYENMGDPYSMIAIWNNLFDIEFATNTRDSALFYAQNAYNQSKKFGYIEGVIESSKRLSKLHAAEKNYEDAYKMFGIYTSLSDSIKTNTNRNSLLLSNIQYEYQKKALADSIRIDEGLKLSELKLKEEENIKIFVIVLLLVCALFLIYLFRRFKLIQKQNNIIEKQKLEVETKNSIIQDSLRELEKAQEKLLKSKAEAEAANASKSTFIANVSHEIRTPLNAVLGFSELLKGSTISPKHEKYIDNILAGGKSLMLLINDILDLSKMEAGHLVFYEKPVSLQSIIDDCNEWVAIQAGEKGLVYELICDPKYLSMQLLIDELRIRQVLFNLLGNAVKFTSKGYVQLSILPETTNRNELIDLSFSVKDTGPGIPPDQQQSVFEAFKQVNGQTNREYGGTGLGLTITKNIVERLNGTILLNSVPGEGSTFTVKLKDVKVIKDVFSKSSSLDPMALNFKGQSILLVEDTALNKELVLSILQSYHLSVHLASNGEEALTFLQKEIPDLILMDLMMPVMDGFEAVREIKKQARTKDIPVIAITALSYGEVDPSQISHFDGYLQKPIRVDDLIQILSKFLIKSN